MLSQKQLPRKMKSHIDIIVCSGYIVWQLFLWRVATIVIIMLVLPRVESSVYNDTQRK